MTNVADIRQSAEAQGVTVMSVSDLIKALLPKLRPGDEIEVKVMKPGPNIGEGIAYLKDGTMVVVEGGRRVLQACAVGEAGRALWSTPGRGEDLSTKDTISWTPNRQ